MAFSPLPPDTEDVRSSGVGVDSDGPTKPGANDGVFRPRIDKGRWLQHVIRPTYPYLQDGAKDLCLARGVRSVHRFFYVGEEPRKRRRWHPLAESHQLRFFLSRSANDRCVLDPALFEGDVQLVHRVL